jgi:hypothetical protein
LLEHVLPSGSRTQTFEEQSLLWQSAPPMQALLVPQSLFCASHCGPPQSISVSLPSLMPSWQETQVPGLLPKQKLLAQSTLAEQCFWSAHFAQEPPQSTSVSFPFCTVSVQEAGVQVWAVGSQTLLTQSLATMHALWSAQGPQEPPQSTSVSSASFTVSVQCIATQLPLPSQTTPPLSLQAVPLTVFWVPQTSLVHVLDLQTVVCAGQSVAALHWTQVPLPSHVLPPLSVQVVVFGAFMVPHALPLHVSTLQAVVWAGQSMATTQATQLPLPSQTSPLLLVQACSAFLLVVPQQPLSHVAVTQSLDGSGQSPTAVHDFAPPVHIMPVLVLAVLAVPVVTSVVEEVADVVPLVPPPVPLILLWSTDAISSHPRTDMAIAPVTKKSAAKVLACLATGVLIKAHAPRVTAERQVPPAPNAK